MGLSRRSRSNDRGEAPIWPGFVDAMTSLLLVLMFVLTIFMIVQFVLRETITTQGNELSSLNAQVSNLADALGLAQSDNAKLKDRVGSLGGQLSDAQAKAQQQDRTIAALTSQLTQRQGALDTANAKITDFEKQVAGLLADRKTAEDKVATLNDKLDAQTEAARLAAARRDALQAMTDQLKSQMAQQKTSLSQALAALDDKTKANADLGQQVSDLKSNLTDAQKQKLADDAAAEALKKKLGDAQDQLSEAEKQKLADAAAAKALQDKLKNSQAELTSMTLALEQERKKAEDTLTMLAAANSAKTDLDIKLAAALAGQSKAEANAADLKDQLQALQDQGQSRSDIEHKLAAALAARAAAEDKAQTQMTEAQKQAALLATANDQLSKVKDKSAESQRQVEVLNQQVAALRSQLQDLQGILDQSSAKEQAKSVQIKSLGNQLNAALAQVAAEQRKRADLEEAERKRLESQNQQLENYRSEFFGKVRAVIAGLPGVKVVGDRFVFSSEVLFPPGAADLSDEGKVQIANVTKILEQVASQIPPGLNWILQVNGYTDATPLSGSGEFKDNWELSQARALSVVHYMVDSLGFPPGRLAASGYGQYQPVASGGTPEARAQNRRIELKLTEK